MPRVVSVLLVLLCTLSRAQVTNTWLQAAVLGPGGAGSPWAGRSGAGLARLAGQRSLLVGGEAAGGAPLTDAWLTADLINWAPLAPPGGTPWSPRVDFAFASNGTAALIAGGRAGASAGGAAAGDAWATADDDGGGGGAGANWTLKAPTSSVWPPDGACAAPARFGAAAAWLPPGGAFARGTGAWLLLGGLPSAPGAPAPACADVVASVDGGSTWVATNAGAPPPWPARGFAAAAALGGRLFLVGGVSRAGAGGAVLGDAWLSADGGASWAAVPGLTSPPPDGWAPRARAALVRAGGVLWLLAGRGAPPTPGGGGNASDGGGPPLADVWRSDASGEAWARVERAALWGARAGAAASDADLAPGGPGVMLVGGVPAGGGDGDGDGDGPPLADVWRSTGNLLCEDNGTVCSGYGNCLLSGGGVHHGAQPGGGGLGYGGGSGNSGGSSSGSSGSSWWDGALARGGDAALLLRPPSPPPPLSAPLPPLPRNCSCDAFHSGARCETRVCDAARCVHGACAALPGGGGRYCACADPAAWTGYYCDVAVCAAGCSPAHGACAGAPGTCACARGWAGAECDLPDTAIVRVGLWLSARPGPFFAGFASVGLALVLGGAAWASAAAARQPFPPGAAAKRELAAAAAAAAAGRGRGAGGGEAEPLLLVGGGGARGAAPGAPAAPAAPAARAARSRHGGAVLFVGAGAGVGAGVGVGAGAGVGGVGAGGAGAGAPGGGALAPPTLALSPGAGAGGGGRAAGPSGGSAGAGGAGAGTPGGAAGAATLTSGAPPRLERSASTGSVGPGGRASRRVQFAPTVEFGPAHVLPD